jgi:uncharacterized Zn-binding protein involved in type VI secretion
MTFAARVGDVSGHLGLVTGPGVPSVLIGGLPAAVAGDLHTCAVALHATTPFAKGSATVFIGGRPALRATDLAGCGAPILTGWPTVFIG